MVRRVFIFITFCAILYIHCAGPLGTRKVLPQLDPEELLRDITAHASRLQTFRGMATLSVVSSLGPFRGTLQILVKMPDSLWIKVEGPLGLDLLQGLIGGDSALVYSPMEKTAYRGDLFQVQSMGLFPMDTDSPGLMLAMLGLLLPIDTDTLGIELSTDDRDYILHFGSGETVRVDPRGPVVSRWEKLDEGGEPLWTWEGMRFKKHKSVWLPQVIRMTHFQPKQQMTVLYERIRMNRPMKEGWYTVRIPEGVETIEL